MKMHDYDYYLHNLVYSQFLRFIKYDETASWINIIYIDLDKTRTSDILTLKH